MSVRASIPCAGVGFVAPCLPSSADRPPKGTGWIHEIKHDGFRMMVRSNGVGVRLFTRNGYDWTNRYPLIRQAAHTLRPARFSLMVKRSIATRMASLISTRFVTAGMIDQSFCMHSISSSLMDVTCAATGSKIARPLW
jgi:ATP dependent DNA ligase domain